jgi:PKD domain-containing protein
MRDRSRRKAIGAVVASLAVIAAGCGSESGSSPVGPSEVFSPGLIEMVPAGAIVHTSVFLQSHIAKVPWHYGSNSTGSDLSYSWDFGDGTITTGGESISHVYATEGTFFATVTASSSESGSQQASSNIQVSSLTGRWSGDYGRVSITQDGLELRGRYLDDPREGIVEGSISLMGTVTFTVTRPGLDPITFTGTAGPGVTTLVGKATGRDAVDRPWKLTRG